MLIKKSYKSFKVLNKNIPKSILAIGIASLLINMSTVVVFSGSTLYMKTVLGTSIALIGVLEGVIEAVSYFTRIFSGVISDFFRNRKIGIILGFSLIAISKPLLAISKTVPTIFISRLLDRTGNGIQASPRDALIGDIAPQKIKGSCYGLRQSLSTIGSTIGAIAGIVILSLSNNNFELMFLLAGIPAFFAVLVIFLFIKENKKSLKENKKRQPIKIKNFRLLGKKFWMLMIVVFLFMLSRFSENFIVLHACENHGLNISYGPMVSVIFNIIAATVAYPIGKLSDKIERTTFLAIGLFVLIAAHLTIYSATSIYIIFLGVIIWGLQFGINQSIVAILVSDYVPKGLRGTGFGVYYVVTAAATAFANFFAGTVASQTGSETAIFFYGTIFAAISMSTLFLVKGKLKSEQYYKK